MKNLTFKEQLNINGGRFGSPLSRFAILFLKSWNAGRKFYHRNCDHE